MNYIHQNSNIKIKILIYEFSNNYFIYYNSVLMINYNLIMDSNYKELTNKISYRKCFKIYIYG